MPGWFGLRCIGGLNVESAMLEGGKEKTLVSEEK